MSVYRTIGPLVISCNVTFLGGLGDSLQKLALVFPFATE